MKELSIEEKAKAYDKAIEVACEYWDSPRTCIDIDVLPKLFPELKESEDERIRKELLNYLYDVHDDDEERARWIAYLEKQGEQKPDSLETTARLLLDELSKSPYNNKPITDAQTIIKELLNFLKDSTSYNPNALNEQKPVDKVEPKFKVEDWITIKE